MQVEALTERVNMLENLLSMSKGPADRASPTASQSRHVFHGHTPASSSAPLIELGEPSTALACQSSEESDLDWSHVGNLLFNFDEANTLDGSETDGVVSTSILEWTPNGGIGKDTAAMNTSFSCSVPVERPTLEEAEQAVLVDEPTKRRRASMVSSDTLENRVSSKSCPGSPVSSIPEPLVKNLLDMYFRKFQTILEIVDEPAFRAGMALDPQGVPPVRDSLLLAMLAAGARFLDDPVSIQQCTATSGECVFVARTKALLEPEIGRADAMTVQALLILGELETSAGNEMSGCMYSGLVSRLVFDLKLDPASSQELNLSDSEINSRHWMLWYASVQDKFAPAPLFSDKTCGMELTRFLGTGPRGTVQNKMSVGSACPGLT
jgi:hypothetical protein